MNPILTGALERVIAAVEDEAERLVLEFSRAEGPRGAGSHCDVDLEIEERLRSRLQAIVPCEFAGEETGMTAGEQPGWTWLVDPHDGTSEFMSGRRGSAVSVGLLRGGTPVLGVVCAPMPPDRGRDTIAWAEGGTLLRNGQPISPHLGGRALRAGEFVWATASSALRPVSWSIAAAPARYIAMPSIAYRMARIAAGDGVATVSTHSVNEYDIAAGMALILAAGGVVLDAEGHDIVLLGHASNRLSGLFAGAPEAARALQRFSWKKLQEEPRRERRVSFAFPRTAGLQPLARAQGCLLGALIGDSLGAAGGNELVDGGPLHTIAGQPTDDGEMSITLARTVVRERGYSRAKVLEAYREWLQTRPIDVAETTERGLLGLHTTESESNGSLARVAPIGLWAAGEPALAADAARADSALTHPNPVCLEACAALCAAIAVGVAGGSREEMVKSALASSSGAARVAVEAGSAGAAPESYAVRRGSVLVALQNAFYRLASASSLEAALTDTLSGGGDSGAHAAVAGALLGASLGRDALPERWIAPILACRPLAEAGAPRPRPMAYWPDDVLELAEALLVSRRV